MAIADVPSDLRDVVRYIADEFRTVCDGASDELVWLTQYEVLELRAVGIVRGRDLEIYLPRPLVEDIANLDLAERKHLLADLRGIPARAVNGESRFWLLREEGRAHPLPQRPFI